MSNYLYDRSGRRCPDCASNELRYVLIPEGFRVWKEGDAAYSTHLPVDRDYECMNCGAEWTMADRPPE